MANVTGEYAKSAHRPEIDGLRALAVVAVIVNHFNKEILPSGYLGVDMFFVISGFVITSSLAGRTSKNFGDFLTGFYTRRIKRLVPALVVFVIVTSIAICLFDPDPGPLLKTGIASLFGFSNIYLLQKSTDYFAVSTELDVFTHTWSLGVEEQFYFLFPFLCWLTGFSRQADKGSRNLFWVVGVLSVASSICFIYFSQSNQPAAYFLMPTRLWELGAGCLLFLGLKQPNGFVRSLERVPPLLVAAVIVSILFIPLEFTVLATITVVVLTVSLIASLRDGTAGYDMFTHPQVVAIGLISYSLYLWHWSVLSLSRWTIGIHWWSVPFQIALMLVLAIVSYRYIETPLRRIEWSLARWRSIAYGFGAVISAAIVLLSLGGPLEGRLFTGKKLDDGLQFSTRLANQSDILARSDQLKAKCNMTPQEGLKKYWRSKPLVDKNFIQRCTNNSPKSKLVLIGDSFAEVSTRHLAVIAKDINYDFRTIYGYRCPYPLRFSEIGARTMERCADVDEELLSSELIAGLNKGDILVLRLYLPKREYLSYVGSKLPPVDAYDRALHKLIGDVNRQGAKLVIIGANPTLSTAHLVSINPQWFNFSSSHNTILPLENPETAYFHSNDSHLEKLIDGMSGATFFSLKPYICNHSGECLLRHQGKVLYFDNQHLTTYAYDLFFNDLRDRITRVSSRTNLKNP
jgi:peptidoglycan/LPS O-acetylase OafA/YrhL